MTVPAPPSLGSVPSPAPTTADPDNFDARADAFHQVFPDLVNKALPAMLAWIKAAADMIKGWAGVAQDSASTARAESGKAATSAAQAASGASTAVDGANAAGASATAAAASAAAAAQYAGQALATTPNSPIRLNPRRISTSFTVPAGCNAASAGPVFIDDGVSVIVAPGANWSIH